MPDAPTTPTTPPATPPTTTPAAQGTPTQPADEGKGGKDAVLKDLATERDKRQALETQVQQLTAAQQTQKDALAKAFGLAPDETSDVAKLADQITTLRDDFTATKHQNVVLSVANEHKISDPDDLALLSEVKDEAKMRALAARLAGGEAGTPSGAPGTPKPDRTQGAGAGAPPSPAQQFASFITGQLDS